MSKYVEPSFLTTSFTCTHCETYAQQNWNQVRRLELIQGKDEVKAEMEILDNYYFTKCQACSNITFWIKDPTPNINHKLIFPKKSPTPPSSEYLPDNVKDVYKEASGVFVESPRASAALLRLACQMLMPYLEESGENLNKDIKNLVENGLPSRIQKALDTLRVTGNHAVHPGTIDINDNAEIALGIFTALNFYCRKNDRGTQGLYVVR